MLRKKEKTSLVQGCEKKEGRAEGRPKKCGAIFRCDGDNVAGIAFAFRVAPLCAVVLLSQCSQLTNAAVSQVELAAAVPYRSSRTAASTDV